MFKMFYIGLIHVLASQLLMCPCIMQKYNIQKNNNNNKKKNIQHNKNCYNYIV